MLPAAHVHYTKEELRVLIEAYERHKLILDGNSGKDSAIRQRAGIWDEIKTMVDNVHGNVRTCQQYRKKLRRLLASLKENDSSSDSDSYEPEPTIAGNIRSETEKMSLNFAFCCDDSHQSCEELQHTDDHDPNYAIAPRSPPAETVVTYTEQELSALLSAYSSNRKILNGRSTKQPAIRKRDRIWNQIKRVVDDVHGNRRTSKQYRKRLRRLLASTSNMERNVRNISSSSNIEANHSEVHPLIVYCTSVEDEKGSDNACLLCSTTISEEPQRKLSNYLLDLFKKWLTLDSDQVPEFQASIRSGSLCNSCHERTLDYQTALEQLELIQKKLSTLSNEIMSSINSLGSGTQRPRFSKIRQHIHKAVRVGQTCRWNEETNSDSGDRKQGYSSDTGTLNGYSETLAKNDIEEYEPHWKLEDIFESDGVESAEVDDDVEIGTPEPADDENVELPSLSLLNYVSNDKVSLTEPNASGSRVELKDMWLLLQRCDDPDFHPPPSPPPPSTYPSRKSLREERLSKRSRVQNLLAKLRRIRSEDLKMKGLKKKRRVAVASRIRRPLENAEHKCSICSYKTSFVTGLESHYKRVHKGFTRPRPFTCSFPDCQKGFSAPIGQEAHENRVHKGISFICPLETCRRRTYYTQHHLGKHQRGHDESFRKFLCDQCDLRFYDLGQLKVHKAGKHEKLKPFMCEMCPSAFIRNTDLEDHQARTHRIVTPRGVAKCEICGFEAATRYYLKTHNKLVHFKESLNFACTEPNCSYKGINASHLRIHSLMHKGRDFKCSQCPKNFKRKHQLKYHIQTVHEGLRVKCPHCSKEYSDNKKVKNHITLVHMPRNFPFMCEICGRSFPLKDYLREHKRRCPRT